MNRILRKVFLLFSSIIFLLFYSYAQAYERTIKIGAGHITGVYYPIAQQICKNIENNAAGKIKCLALKTKGSTDNIKLLYDGKIDFAIMQADTASNIYINQEATVKQAQVKLRLVSGLFNEALTLAVREDSEITSLDDLKNQNIFMSSKNINSQFLFKLIAKFYKWNSNQYPKFSKLNLADTENALCNKSIDAIILTIAHPNGFFNDLTRKCEIKFINLEEKLRTFITNSQPYYKLDKIEKNLYPGIGYDTYSIGTQAVLITSNMISFETVKLLLNELIKFQQNTQNSFITLQKLNFNIILNYNSIIPLHIESQNHLKNK